MIRSMVDAAVVIVNASSRFTDGAEFGFGAEIGISTQKLHARGPMALTELTTTKWVVEGDGQVGSTAHLGADGLGERVVLPRRHLEHELVVDL